MVIPRSLLGSIWETVSAMYDLEFRSGGQAEFRFAITHKWYLNPPVGLQRRKASVRISCVILKALMLKKKR